MKSVFLTGFAGAGKTTVGRILARKLGWEFHDLDEEIASHAGSTIPEIFAREGEEEFRRREAALLSELLARPGVHSLGGGALLHPGSRRAVRAHGPLVYLRARPETLAARLAGGERASRPLLAGEGPMVDAVADLLRRREPLYREADWTVETDGLSPQEVAEIIAGRVMEDR